MNRPEQMKFDSAIVKIREPEQIKNVKIGLLLHGWTGDESSMWVFGNKFDQDWLLISPRAPYSTVDAEFAGYSWVDQSISQWPTHQEFFSSVNYLESMLSEISKKYLYADFSKISLIGFSQGAAMAFVYAGVKSPKIKKLVLLSGFLPEGNEGYIKAHQFNKVDIFIGHGNLDDLVPIIKAEEAKHLFEGNSKTLVYCVSDVGHRLGSDCFIAFQKFIKRE